MHRRSFLASVAGTAVGIELATKPTQARSSFVAEQAADTLDAFADTIIPGAKRYPEDLAVAGVAAGPSGADAGYLQLLAATDLRSSLDGIAALLNTRAAAYALSHWILLPPWPAPFIALSYPHRSSVVVQLYQSSDPDRDLWAVMALLSSLAFDAASHLSTVDAIRLGHPGLRYLRFPAPQADGLWRFDEFSYRRRLADEHPGTSGEGQPA